jgi:endonuclease-3
MPVDTHVHRISNRIGFVKTKTPEQTELELKKTIPKKYWLDLNELFVKFGQRLCRPIAPRCPVCPVLEFCGQGRAVVRKIKTKQKTPKNNAQSAQ